MVKNPNNQMQLLENPLRTLWSTFRKKIHYFWTDSTILKLKAILHFFWRWSSRWRNSESLRGPFPLQRLTQLCVRSREWLRRSPSRRRRRGRCWRRTRLTPKFRFGRVRRRRRAREKSRWRRGSMEPMYVEEKQFFGLKPLYVICTTNVIFHTQT